MEGGVYGSTWIVHIKDSKRSDYEEFFEELLRPRLKMQCAVHFPVLRNRVLLLSIRQRPRR